MYEAELSEFRRRALALVEQIAQSVGPVDEFQSAPVVKLPSRPRDEGLANIVRALSTVVQAIDKYVPR